MRRKSAHWKTVEQGGERLISSTRTCVSPTEKASTVLVAIGTAILLIFANLWVPEGMEEGRAAASVDTLSVGVATFDDPGETIEKHRDFVEYLGRKLSPTGEIKGRVVVVRTALQLAKAINQKKVDFYVESPYPTFLINEQTGAKVLVRRWKGGVPEYHSIIFAKKESGVTRFEDLLGKIIAFEDPTSTSAYFLPKAFLIKRGFRLTEKFSFQAKVRPNEIGYLFTYDEENILNWVLLSKVAAGAFSNIDFDKFDPRRRAEVIVLAETEVVPRHLLSVRKDLDPSLVSRLEQILLVMHLDEEGQRAMRKADKTTKFDPLPGGEEVMYRKIRELFLILQQKRSP